MHQVHFIVVNSNQFQEQSAKKDKETSLLMDKRGNAKEDSHQKSHTETPKRTQFGNKRLIKTQLKPMRTSRYYKSLSVGD